MAEGVVIQNVTLRGDDLNFGWSPWRDVNRANNLRLLPILLGFLASTFALSFLIDPSAMEIAALLGPLLLGWWGFIWVTNAVYLSAYKRAYERTPVGSEPCTFAFDAEGMHQTMPRGRSSYRWSAFVEVVDDERGFRFWFSPFLGVFLPARFVDEEKGAELRRLIEDARQRGDIKGP